MPLLLLVLLIVDLSLGATVVSPVSVMSALLSSDGNVVDVVIRSTRLPRAVAAISVGAALGLSGYLLQAATRNRFASPGLLGVNAGAYLFLTLALLLPPAWHVPPVLAAFVGGLAAAGLVLLLAGGAASPYRLLLAGVAVSIGLGSTASGVLIFQEESIAGFAVWAAGSVEQMGWASINVALPYLLVGASFGLVMGRVLDVLELGDDQARALGQHVTLARTATVAVATLLAAASVSIAGPISFIGLVAPHLLRLAGFRRSAPLAGGSMVVGAAVLLVADVGANLLTVSGQATGVPAGAVAALLGAPLLVVLLQRERVILPRGAPDTPALTRRRAAWPLMGILCILVVALVFAGVMIGEKIIGPWDMLALLEGTGDGPARLFVMEFRLPRILVALLAGALLAVSGLILQSLIRNPLASPEVLGISQGAALAALSVSLAIPAASPGLLQSAAFAGGVSSLLLILALSWRGRLMPEHMALIGVGLAALLAALISIVLLRAGHQGAQVLAWLSGTTYGRGWADFASLVPWAALLVPAGFVAARVLDISGLGEEASTQVGLPPARVRLVMLPVAVALAAAAVATVGPIAFIGLMAPHAARLLTGSHHRVLVPAAALIGSAALGSADIIGRTIMAPHEVPAGLVAAIVGAPYFALLLRVGRGR